jgi:DNA-directed RNA polymerase subunit M/transcription elongation factor TFIIS
MKFCQVCENMMYHKIGKEKDVSSSITLFCRKCGNEEAIPSTECVSRRVLKSTAVTKPVLSKYTKFDPTLPRVQMKCASEECPNTTIIVVRYAEAQLKYIHLCPECNGTW